MKSRKVLLAIVLIIVVLFITSCGSSTTSASSSVTTPTAKIVPKATSTPPPTPTPGLAHSGQTALQILQSLKTHSLPVGVYFNYTGDNDVNHLMGRPGQYTGKLNFKDTRILSSDAGVNIGVPDGGSIEVFANMTDAKHRFAYIQAISTSGAAMFAEYEYLDGAAILRISPQLSPGLAAQYKAAFEALQ
jgi:hypothetical protein